MPYIFLPCYEKANRGWDILNFVTGSYNKREKKIVKTSAAEDIGFSELKITKVSIRSELFAFGFRETARELTYLVHFHVAFSHFNMPIWYAPIRKLNTESRNICAITVSRFKAKLFYLTWFHLTNFLSEMYGKKSWRTVSTVLQTEPFQKKNKSCIL